MQDLARPIGRFVALVFFVLYTIYIEFVCMPYFQFDVDSQYRIIKRQYDGYWHIISYEWKSNVHAADECTERKQNGSLRFCKYERCYKPDRAHYCRQLGRNVLKMDHYCPWASCNIMYN
ncbi:Palmitoyltransferase [Babesia duncani]|uniref:Palmitoyltransferase n=1 Tax=Babesia duncani TaxID=323732 RepID=A0AAD9UQ37_9APIC|nr:Palmitoyltransferase [Babesia duncani]